jgi:nucleoside-diphosphate-sugar epimerase
MFAPISEELTPRWDDGSNFYHPQEDFMFALQKQRQWSYNIIRPQAIIGFTPGRKWSYNTNHISLCCFRDRWLMHLLAASGMTAALKLVQYLIICRETGDKPRFPGNEMFYNYVDDCSYAPSIADLSVWATTQEHTKNEAFNHANGDAFSWRWFFPRLGKYLGVEVSHTTQITSYTRTNITLMRILDTRHYRLQRKG